MKTFTNEEVQELKKIAYGEGKKEGVSKWEHARDIREYRRELREIADHNQAKIRHDLDVFTKRQEEPHERFLQNINTVALMVIAAGIVGCCACLIGMCIGG